MATLVIAVGLACTAAQASGKMQDIQGTTAGNCMLNPVTVPLFGGTPAAVIAASPAADLQAGTADVDQATLAAGIADIMTCINTGDPSYQYAIFTPRYLAAQFVEEAGHYQPEFEWRLNTPAQPASTQFELVSIEGIETQADGRVQVTLVLRAGQDTYGDTFLLALVDGHCLIDEIVSLDPAP